MQKKCKSCGHSRDYHTKDGSCDFGRRGALISCFCKCYKETEEELRAAIEEYVPDLAPSVYMDIVTKFRYHVLGPCQHFETQAWLVMAVPLNGCPIVCIPAETFFQDTAIGGIQREHRFTDIGV